MNSGIHTTLWPNACWDTHRLAHCMLGYTPPWPIACSDTHPWPIACWDTHPSCNQRGFTRCWCHLDYGLEEIFTTRQPSLGQGNVFTLAAHFSCRTQPSAQDTWIGLYKTTDDPNTFRCVADTPFLYNGPGQYHHWWSGEPNEPSLSCVRLRADKAYTWADYACSADHWALCEKGKCSYILSIQRRFPYFERIFLYRLGTVNSKSFVGKDFLRNKWKYELTVHFKHEMIAK